MIVALFEDEKYKDFLPLTYTKPIFTLHSGMFSVAKRAEKILPSCRILLFSRDYLVPTLEREFNCHFNAPQKIDEDLLLINGALILDQQTIRIIRQKLAVNVALMKNGRLVAAKLGERIAREFGRVLAKPMTGADMKMITKNCKVLKGDNLPLMDYPWDLIDNCSKLITSDFELVSHEERSGTIDERAVIYGEKSNLVVADGAFIEAFVTLDVRNGPVYVGKNSIVQSGSRITGPAHIGDDTIIASALLRDGCSIGNVCRVGGEIEKTIIHSYSNRHHLGYLGHSYIGEWVNIAASTTCSNLKSTYGTVNMNLDGKKVNTGRNNIGCFIGDHAKTSIGTQIYTGKKIGIASQVHGFVTQDVPSFTLWAKSLGAKPCEIFLESVIETQRRAFMRRGVKQTKQDVELLRKLFIMTAHERKKASVVKEKLEL